MLPFLIGMSLLPDPEQNARRLIDLRLFLEGCLCGLQLPFSCKVTECSDLIARVGALIGV